MKKKYLVALVVAIAAMLGASIVWSAQAAPPDDKKCYETVVVDDGLATGATMRSKTA